MKRIALYGICMALLLLLGCQNEEERFVVQQQGNRTITAIIDNGLGMDDISTRTEVDAEGHVTWTEKDTLGVFSNVSQNVPFASTGSGGNVDFTGTLTEEDKDIKCVYFPYNKDVKLEGNKLTLKLPRIYNYTDENLTPMLGEEQEDETFKFKHLCGVMRVRIKNAPKGVSNLDILGYNLHGTAYVADVTAPNATLVRSGNVETSMRIKFNLKEISDVTLYIPLIPDTYKRIELEYKDSKNNKIFKNKSVKTPVTITPGMLLDMPVLTALDDDAVGFDYLNKIEAYIQAMENEPYLSLKEKLISWLGNQSYVEKLELSEYTDRDDYNITLRGGMPTGFSFFYDGEPNVESRSVIYNPYEYFDKVENIFNIPYREGELIIDSMGVKSFSILDFSDISINQEEFYRDSELLLWHEADKSPIKLDVKPTTFNKNIILDEFINTKKENNSFILMTDTHGYGEGVFYIMMEGNIGHFNNKFFSKYHKVYPSYYDKEKGRIRMATMLLHPQYLIDKGLFNDTSVLFGSYCSSAAGSSVLHYDLSCNFLGYDVVVKAGPIRNNVIYFANALFNGKTVEEAYEYQKAKRHIFYEDLKYNRHNRTQRYFSISTNEISENNTLTGTINGYKNLKESIKYYIYYQEGTEEFTPDKVSNKNKREIKPNNSGAIEYAFTDLEPGKTYTYAIGFEYNDKYYYGDLKQFVFAEPVQTVDECTVESLNATCSGYVYAEIDDIEEYGICYSATAPEPSINDKGGDLIIALNENKMFSVTLSNLESKTKYYYRAYAKFKGQDEPKYGEVCTFETNKTELVNTDAASDITHLSATTSGYVYEEEDAIAEYGICYSASETPSIVIGETIKATELDEQGKFSVALDYLEPGTTYYYCAYAVINGEPVYGEIKSFKTQEAPLTPGTAIDLGLPSGTKWASHNLGASSPEGYGGLYGWGDPTGEHTEPMLNNSGYIDKNLIYYGGLEDAPLTISGGKLDVAKAKWGGRWRLPTKDEILELINNCTHEYVVVGNTPGVKFVGINGNSIFLPFAGMRTLKGGDRKHDVESGFYWSGTRCETGTNPWRAANSLSISYSGYLDIGLWSCGRAGGLSVRPVR